MTSAMRALAWPRTRRLLLGTALTLLVAALVRTGYSESSSDVCVSMENSDGQVAGIQAEFQWDRNCMTALTGSNGRPQCNADPSTGKDVHAALTPRGSLKALLFSMSDLGPMPDGNMFCCSFTFEGRPGCCGLTMGNVLGSDPSGGQNRSFDLVATVDGAVCGTTTGTGGGGAAPRAPAAPAAPMAPPVGAVGGVPAAPAAPGGAAPAAPGGAAAPMRRAPGGDANVPPPAGGAAAEAAPQAPAAPTVAAATPRRTPAAAGTPTAARTPATPKAASTVKTTPEAAKPTPEGTPGQPTPKAAKATPAAH